MFVLSTDSLKGYGLNRIFKFAKEAKYDGIDLTLDNKNFDTFNTEYLKELSKKYELPIIAIQAPKNANPDTILEIVEMAKQLNTKVIIIQPPKIFKFKYAQWLRQDIPKIRIKEKISIALENGPDDTILGIIPAHAMNNLRELRRFKHACIDTTRLAKKKQDLLRSYNILKPYIVHIHISNVYRNRGYSLLQEGVLPLESFFTKLKRDRFAGAISLKINPKYMEVGKDKRVKIHLEECREFFEEYFK